MRIVRMIAALAMIVASSSAWSWNDRGHMLVAAVAWNNMEPETRARASELIKLNPHFDILSEGTKKSNRDQVAFIRAATWPDLIKQFGKKPQDAGPDDYIDHGNDPKGSPDPNRNIGYEDKFLHKYWHFVDLPFSVDGSRLAQPAKPNALTRIVLHRDTIASTEADDDVKSYDLVWLLHIIGDVHQPLHATSRFTANEPDAGGNLVNVCDGACSSRTKKSLHSIWDGSAGKNSDVFAVIKAAGNLEDAPAKDAEIDDPEKWINESFEIAKKSVYRKPVLAGSGPFVITPSYKAKASDIAEERIALAGVRLANMLDAFLK